MDILLLHNHPELREQCCELINSEWPRSRTARMRSIDCSCDSLPTCLVLVKTLDNEIKQVVGHSKVSAIPSIPHGAFIESVIIHKDLRGKGLGRLLMQGAEDFIKSNGYKEAYLSTFDQQIFYSKLGYEFCERVSIYGGSIGNFFQVPKKTTNLEQNGSTKPIVISSPDSSVPIPPPFPQLIRLPPPPPKLPDANANGGTPKKDFMKKLLS